jgi:hypothetical protein
MCNSNTAYDFERQKKKKREEKEEVTRVGMACFCFYAPILFSGGNSPRVSCSEPASQPFGILTVGHKPITFNAITMRKPCLD